MKCFDQVKPWPNKVNYVDDNNRVLGFDMQSSCCEHFGHGVFSGIPTDETKDTSVDITAYAFAGERPTDCLNGSGLAFRIVAPNAPDLFVVIWNYHNGYYSHGWDFNGDSGDL